MQEEKTEIERCDFIHVHEDVVKKVKINFGMRCRFRRVLFRLRKAGRK